MNPLTDLEITEDKAFYNKSLIKEMLPYQNASIQGRGAVMRKPFSGSIAAKKKKKQIKPKHNNDFWLFLAPWTVSMTVRM